MKKFIYWLLVVSIMYLLIFGIGDKLIDESISYNVNCYEEYKQILKERRK